VKYPVIRDLQTRGRKVFLRADLNVPLASGQIADDTRIRAMLPTLRFLLEQGSSVILASHLGRPKGSVNPDLSLRPIAEKLSELLRIKVIFAPDCVGPYVEQMASTLGLGDTLLLENLRFHPEEENCEEGFSRKLASLAELYVNDAFGTCHRKHASMCGIPRVLGGGSIGFLVERELDVFDSILSFPDKPFTLLLGGAKVADKIPVIRHLLDRIDNLLVGGGMAFTFLRAMGRETGTSIVEEGSLDTAAGIIEDARNMGVNVMLPFDLVVAHSSAEGAYARMVPADGIPPDQAGLDIGAETAEAFAGVIRESGTVVWNGPMGLFEVPPFDNSTRIIASTLAEATSRGTTTVVGGGDTVRAVVESGVVNRLTWVSTGGGASLKLLGGKELPALKALEGGST
jgi:phosphoglycerate kinase